MVKRKPTTADKSSEAKRLHLGTQAGPSNTSGHPADIEQSAHSSDSPDDNEDVTMYDSAPMDHEASHNESPSNETMALQDAPPAISFATFPQRDEIPMPAQNSLPQQARFPVHAPADPFRSAFSPSPQLHAARGRSHGRVNQPLASQSSPYHQRVRPEDSPFLDPDTPHSQADEDRIKVIQQYLQFYENKKEEARKMLAALPKQQAEPQSSQEGTIFTPTVAIPTTGGLNESAATQDIAPKNNNNIFAPRSEDFHRIRIDEKWKRFKRTGTTDPVELEAYKFFEYFDIKVVTTLSPDRFSRAGHKKSFLETCLTQEEIANAARALLHIERRSDETWREFAARIRAAAASTGESESPSILRRLYDSLPDYQKDIIKNTRQPAGDERFTGFKTINEYCEYVGQMNGPFQSDAGHTPSRSSTSRATYPSSGRASRSTYDGEFFCQICGSRRAQKGPIAVLETVSAQARDSDLALAPAPAHPEEPLAVTNETNAIRPDRDSRRDTATAEITASARPINPTPTKVADVAKIATAKTSHGDLDPEPIDMAFCRTVHLTDSIADMSSLDTRTAAEKARDDELETMDKMCNKIDIKNHNGKSPENIVYNALNLKNPGEIRVTTTVFVEDEMLEALLDTGATRSFINTDVVERLQLKIHEANGHIYLGHKQITVPRMGETEAINFSCNGHTITTSFEVFEVEYPIVIGMDLFSRLGFSIQGIDDGRKDATLLPTPIPDTPPNLVPLETPEEETTPEFIAEKAKFLKEIKKALKKNKAIPKTSYCPLEDMKVYLPVRKGKSLYRRPRIFAETQQPIFDEQIKKWI
ncbi:hypothetical protein BGZ98_010264 [Dissophora globulifera]|nr:hypothetical protein BGZ98_010264 [Dissophora globulifera]